MHDRTIFIGDVHGCTAELLTLLGALRVKPQRDRVVFLGDLVDKGPDSLGALRLARQTLQQLPGSLCIMGNHEKKWLRKATKPEAERPPEMHGVRPDDLAFIAAMPLFKPLPDIGWFAVHGGVFPRLIAEAGVLTDEDAVYPHPTDKQRGKLIEKVAHTRRIDSRGDYVTLDQEVTRGVQHWSASYKGDYGIIAFGHEPYPQPIVAPSALGIDTGCCYGWSLSAAIVRGLGEKPEIVSVPALKQYAAHSNEA